MAVSDLTVSVVSCSVWVGVGHLIVALPPVRLGFAALGLEAGFVGYFGCGCTQFNRLANTRLIPEYIGRILRLRRASESLPVQSSWR
jgi:hypothetical protein